jgi:ribosomal protein S1
VKIDQRIIAEVIAVDLDAGQAQLSTAAAENPEVWAVQVGPRVSCEFHQFARELDRAPLEAPEDAVQVGDEVTALITEFDRERRQPAFSRCRIPPGHH